MKKDTVWPSEVSVYQDTLSGVTVKKCTNYYAHSFHTYFTNNGWYQDKLLIGSDRRNVTNLYGLNLENGTMRQLTDFNEKAETSLQGAFINPTEDTAYFTADKHITALDLNTLEQEKLYEQPQGYHFSNISCTADGNTLCFALVEDLSHRISSNLSSGYGGFEEIEAARPHSQICTLTLATKEVQVIHEEHRWIGHVNASPTENQLLSFCHEGPWEKVDHRIWMMDIEMKKVWKIRGGFPGQYAGHEYWHADGLHIGYHGFTETLAREDGKFLGATRYDNTGTEEFHFPYQNMHIHSNDTALIVGDGQQASAYHGETYKDCVFLWKKVGGAMQGPRILCRHRGSFHSQKVHVHPRFSPDGTKVLFTSDRNGYGDVYLVTLPPFEELPEVPEQHL